MEYNFSEIERKWQKYWAEKKTFKAENNSSKPKYYVLDMFPYPSGAGLHVGHPLGYIASDIYARYKRLKGFNVLHPMGFDSFGLPAEQYAIQTGQHPAITTEKNIERYREQLDKIGLSFDWDREVRTSDPEFYKWTQWIFLKLFNSWYNPKTNKAEPIDILTKEFEVRNSKFEIGNWNELNEKQRSETLMDYRLAYLSEAYVNWCSALGTVLANDEVKDGVSERGGYPVERKLMKQWSLRITSYAQRLLDDLETIDWSESIKEQQRNWIGRSEGASLKFEVRNSKFEIEVFTTRPDTIFGVTYLALSPEHELVNQITTADQKEAVMKYVEEAKNRSDRERMADVKHITGVFTRAYAEHPFTKKQIPIWIGDYVLAGYGTGAVMAVPAHDSRDFAFAKHFNLPIVQVIKPPQDKGLSPGEGLGEVSYDEKEGTCINSGFLNGLKVKDAIKKAIEEIEKRGIGKGKINFKLRDAVFGRQRYWGEPIPIYYRDGIPLAVDEKDLPVILPEVDKYLPTEDGEPPLARAKNWKYKNQFDFEHTTMPGWAGSSWYYLRYMDPKNKNEFASKAALNYWKDVDLYIGGAEHATGHLMYVRFWTKFLFDLGLIPIQEPAKKLVNQGMIQGVSLFIAKMVFESEDGEKIELFATNDNIVRTDENNKARIIDFNNKKYKYIHDKGQWRIPIDYSGGNSKLFREDFINLIDDPYFKTIAPDVTAANVNEKVLWRFDSEGQYIFLKRENENQNDQDDIPLRSEVEKMSKSKHNVVSPDDVIEKHGADCLRLYEMFLGPLEMAKPWNTNGISGTSNFIRKLWRLCHSKAANTSLSGGEGRGEVFYVSDEPPTKQEFKALHKLIKKVSEDIENLSFNTSVSSSMICVNELTELKCNKRAILEPLAIVISPFAPHIAEELWQLLGHNESITFAKWMDYKEEYLTEDSFAYPISVNGRTKFNLQIALNLSKDEIEKEVMSSEEVKKLLQGQPPKKIIVVPGRIVNIVV